MKNNKLSYKLRSNALRYLILYGLLGGLFFHGFIRFGIFNRAIGLIFPPALADIPTVQSSAGLVPNWSEINFQGMLMQSSGNISYPTTNMGEQTRVWSSGESIAQFMKLGDFQNTELNLDSLNLSQISQGTGISTSSLKLSDFQLLNWQTLPSLVKAIPSLGNILVSKVKPIDDFVTKMGIPNDKTIGELSNYDVFQHTQISSVISLKQYPLESIPGINDAKIDSFNDWRYSTIDGVPGLSNLTWNNLPGLQSIDISFIGNIDLPLGVEEANRIRTLSGSDQAGYNVPCQQSSCPHTELAGPGNTTGMQWISGQAQQVRGGFGVLGSFNGSQEPTGRNPFGSAFKQVIWTIDESKGSVETMMFFRFCDRGGLVDLGCTPYFIGPVGFIDYREKDPIILGEPHR